MSQNNLPAITSDQARGAINIALTRHQYAIQSMQTEADALTFSEDQEGLDAAKAYLDKAKKIEAIVEETHKTGKAPYKAGGDAWDEAKRGTLASMSLVTNPVQQKYNALATKLANAAREKKAKEDREATIRQGVESAIIEYSKQIAAAQTVQELTRIELSISNQKSPSAKSKYGDLHDEAIAAYNERIIPLLKDKKTALDALGSLETEIGESEDWDRIQELEEKIEQTKGVIQDAEVRVQENALGASFTEKRTHEVIIPSVKPRRTTIHWELVDQETAIKRAKDLLSISTNDEACKTVGNSLLGGKENEKKTEVVHNGIRFYKKFLY